MKRKLIDLKTDAKASRIERLELLTKINYVAKNANRNAIQYVIKEIIELEMRKKYLILYLATVNNKLVESGR